MDLKSALWSLNWRDAFKAAIHGFVAGGLSAMGLILKNAIAVKVFTFNTGDLKFVLWVAVAGAVTALGVRFGTDEQGKLLGRY